MEECSGPLDCMKILYIAHERRIAEFAADRLRRIARDVTVTWAASPAAATVWIQANGDVGAVIVDAATMRSGGVAFREQVRDIGATMPIAMIAPEQMDGLLATLRANLDAEIGNERNRREILEAQLREIDEWRRQAQRSIVQGQAQHDAVLASTTKTCMGLQERLLELEAALGHADERHTAQAASTERLARREAELAAAVAEAAAVRTALELRVADGEAARQRAHQHAAGELAAASELYRFSRVVLPERPLPAPGSNSNSSQWRSTGRRQITSMQRRWRR